MPSPNRPRPTPAGLQRLGPTALIMAQADTRNSAEASTSVLAAIVVLAPRRWPPSLKS